MFRKNDSYRQVDLFGVETQLSKKQRKMWESSLEHRFFEQIFQRIDEERFSVLYSEKASRPNVAVNQLVGSLILKHLFDWTYEELFKHLSFNMLTRHAIGLQRMDTDIFAEASIYNFQQRLIEHYTESGKDLLMELFDNLTQDQLNAFGIKTDIQRGDSFLLGSNIFDFTRLQLLIEVLKRLYRILSEEDQGLYHSAFEAYKDKTAGQYIYRVEKASLPKELSQLGQSYHLLHHKLKDQYGQHAVFQIFSRVYQEHFTLVENKLEIIPSENLHSAILMSPDDLEATFRKKANKNSKGYVGHLSETANPENEFQLITDLALEPNNVDDATILSTRIEKMTQKTPDLEMYYTDGLYGSDTVDELFQEAKITQYQTGIRGRKSYGELRIEKSDEQNYAVTCGGGQRVIARKRKSWVARFDAQICNSCALAKKCNTQLRGKKKQHPTRVWYFNQTHIRRHIRLSNFSKLPDKMKTLRANVEATVRQAQFGVKNGKVRVRTQDKVRLYLTLTTIGINLKRVHGYLNNENRPQKDLNAHILHISSYQQQRNNIIDQRSRENILKAA